MRRSVAVAVALFGAGVASWPITGWANTVVVNNSGSTATIVEAYTGNSATSFSGFTGTTYDNNEWGSNIGSGPNDPYVTTQASVTWTGGDVIGSTVDIQFTTQFSGGVDTRYAPTDVYAADIFISSAGGATPGSFNYAVALGYDGPDGSITSKGGSDGLYAINSSDYKTSQTIWSGRSGFIYGGRFGLASSCTPTCSGEAAPTVVTGGTYENGISEVSTDTGGVMNVSLTATTAAGLAELNQIFGSSTGFDIFWGTGDCSNAPIFADITGLTDTSVPEPGSVALLGSALLCFVMLRRRRAIPA